MATTVTPVVNSKNSMSSSSHTYYRTPVSLSMPATTSRPASTRDPAKTPSSTYLTPNPSMIQKMKNLASNHHHNHNSSTNNTSTSILERSQSQPNLHANNSIINSSYSRGLLNTTTATSSADSRSTTALSHNNKSMRNKVQSYYIVRPLENAKKKT